jgi:hypothetical protein
VAKLEAHTEAVASSAAAKKTKIVEVAEKATAKAAENAVPISTSGDRWKLAFTDISARKQ